MTAYAPNPPNSNSGPASLSASLLARKGEAAPAVDAEAHQGVDIAMAAMRHQHPPGHKPRGRAAQQAAPDASADAEPRFVRDPSPRGNVRILRPRANPREAVVKPAGALSPPADFTARMKARRAAAARAKAADDGRKATVTFRMPAREFVRLYTGARALDMTCQSVIVDAVSAYLDANDADVLAEDDFERELEKLSAHMKRAAQKD